MIGIYERLVGTVKRALRKSIGNCHLTIDQLGTLLIEAEVVVNSRPLVYVSEEIGSDCMITLSHFLSVKHNTVFPAFQTHFEQSDLYFLSHLSSLIVVNLDLVQWLIFVAIPHQKA